MLKKRTRKIATMTIRAARIVKIIYGLWTFLKNNADWISELFL